MIEFLETIAGLSSRTGVDTSASIVAWLLICLIAWWRGRRRSPESRIVVRRSEGSVRWEHLSRREMKALKAVATDSLEEARRSLHLSDQALETALEGVRALQGRYDFALPSGKQMASTTDELREAIRERVRLLSELLGRWEKQSKQCCLDLCPAEHRELLGVLLNARSEAVVLLDLGRKALRKAARKILGAGKEFGALDPVVRQHLRRGRGFWKRRKEVVEKVLERVGR